jgi:DNA-binding SARP family transcriptional activator/tetratricopeptide (TPR) repeat protein
VKSEAGRLGSSQATVAYRLRLLGGLAIEAPGGLPEGAATRPRSLALLAILAAGGETGVSRDRLLLYLWPDSDTRRARNSLHQTLYAVRRHLGQDAILAGASHLELNPALVSSDLGDFESALDRGAVEDAIALYTGPFLDGFTLAGLPELERWTDEERRRLARRYADALEAAAARASKEGMHRLAVERWGMLASNDPLSSRLSLGLMRALVAAGNRASALRHAREHEELVRAELGTEPDPAITALAAELRNRTSREAAELATVAPPETPVVPTSSAPLTASASVEPAPSAPAPAGPPPIPVPTPQRHRRLAGRSWKVAVVVLVLVDLLALGTYAWRRWGRSDLPTEPGLVAVFPFIVEGGPDVRYLGTGLVDLLSTNLEGAGELRSVDPQVLLGRISEGAPPVRTPADAARAAAGLGAELYLLGTVVESGGRLHLRAAMYDRAGGEEPLARAAVEGTPSELFDLVDELTTQLLAQGRRGPLERLARVAAATTGSLEALKSYLTGERELRAGRYVPALEAFQRATAVDTGFALAHYRLSIAAEWAGDDSLARAAAESAARFAGRLAEHDRSLLEALLARRAARNVEAERLYRDVVDDYPDDVEAWLQLGQLLFQTNPLRGRSATEARGPLERVLALDPENEEALVHLARIASIEGDRAELDRLMQRLLTLGSDTEVLETRAFRAFALGDRDAWKRVTRELLRDPPDVPPVTALQVATYLDDLDGAEQFARLLRDHRYSDDVRGMAHRLLARVAVARGQWRAAQAQLDSARTLDPVAALELRSLLAVLPFLEVPRPDLVAIRREVEAWPAKEEVAGETSHSVAHVGLHPYVRLYRLGLLDTRLGDTVQALRQAAALERAADSTHGLEADAISTFARSIRARVAGEQGRHAEALAHLEQAHWSVVESFFEAEALDRFYRAELLQAVGRDAEALDWYRTIAERATYELVYVAPARWRQGQIYEQRGDRARALTSYRAVIRLWREADPALRSVVIEASRRARELGAKATDQPPQRAPGPDARYGFSTGSRTAFPHSVHDPS